MNYTAKHELIDLCVDRGWTYNTDTYGHRFKVVTDNGTEIVDPGASVDAAAAKVLELVRSMEAHANAA